MTHLSPFFHEHPRNPISPWHPEHLLFPLPRVLGTHLVPPLSLCACELLSLEWCFFISSPCPALTFFKLCSNITFSLLIYFRIVFSAITCCRLNPSLSSPLLHLWTSFAIWNCVWFMFVVGFNKSYEFKDLANLFLFSWHLEESFELSRCSTNVCWKTKWIQIEKFH